MTQETGRGDWMIRAVLDYGEPASEAQLRGAFPEFTNIGAVDPKAPEAFFVSCPWLHALMTNPDVPTGSATITRLWADDETDTNTVTVEIDDDRV